MVRPAAALIKIAATFFGLGYLPLMSGTIASIAGFLIFIFLGSNTACYILITILVLILGFTVCGRAERLFKQKDCRRIVIDEVAGMFVALLFLPYGFRTAVSAFLLFRILDITKPYPARSL